MNWSHALILWRRKGGLSEWEVTSLFVAELGLEHLDIETELS